MKGYVNLTHTNNSAIEKVSQKVDEIQDDYVTKDTTELTNYYTKNQTYTKEEVDNKTTNVYRAKGSVQTYQDLPTEGNQVGDVYNVIEAYEDYPAGTNFVWTDTSTWDALGGEISVIQGVSQEDFDALVNNETQIQKSGGGFIAGGSADAGSNSVAIGYQAKATFYAGQVAIGGYTSAYAAGSVAIGSGAKTTKDNAIQLGSGTNNTANSLQIYDDNIYNADTHTLTVQNAEINGTPAYGVLSGTSAPTTTTVGAVGQFYLDTTNKQLYQCMSITTESVDEVDTNVYEWTNLSESGVSQTDFDALVNNETQINSNDNHTFRAGNSEGFTGNYSVSIGEMSNSAGRGVAVGYRAENDASFGSVAIGYRASTEQSSNGKKIQLGQGSNSIGHSFQVFDDNIYKTDTHTLTVNNIEQNGNPVYAVLQGTTAPTSTTVGAVGQFYLDTTNKQLYQCVAINIEDLTYEWKQIGGSGSGKYLHRIYIIGINYRVYFEMTTSDNKAYDKHNIVQAIKDYINTTTTNNILATGYISNNTYGFQPVISINYFSDAYISIYYIKNNLILASIDDTSHMVTGITTSYSTSSVLSSNITELIDTVVEL